MINITDQYFIFKNPNPKGDYAYFLCHKGCLFRDRWLSHCIVGAGMGYYNIGGFEYFDRADPTHCGNGFPSKDIKEKFEFICKSLGR